jgi:hypothetical protein
MQLGGFLTVNRTLAAKVFLWNQTHVKPLNKGCVFFLLFCAGRGARSFNVTSIVKTVVAANSFEHV